jgi:hypothetical protein
MERERVEYTNPFAGSSIRVTVCKDENRIDESALKLIESEVGIADFNEFYVLFNNGTLIKRGRSKFRSSDYLKGKHYGKEV